MRLDETLQLALQDQIDNQRYRRRVNVSSAQGVELFKNGRRYLSFCSNDYLGLANHPKVVEAFQLASKKYGVGSGASHLVNGHSEEHHLLENELAEFTGRARALLFSSGYMANVGVINALTSREDVIFQDRLNHASLIDGGLLSRAKVSRYRHQDISHLRTQIESSRGKRKLIVTDGVFSMDGDVAKVTELAQLATQNNAWLMVDDAHGFGFLGDKGGGIAEYYQLDVNQLPILIGTLGKSFGTYGAFVCGSEQLIEYLIQFARSYIYTTAVPPAIAAATRCSLKLLSEENFRREHLQKIIAYFRDGCTDIGLQPMESNTPIQPIILADDRVAVSCAKKLMDKNIWVTAIRPPTVPEGTSRLRITLSSDHTFGHIDELLDSLKEVIINGR